MAAPRTSPEFERCGISVTIAVCAVFLVAPIGLFGQATTERIAPVPPESLSESAATLPHPTLPLAAGPSFALSSFGAGGGPNGIAYDSHLDAMAVANNVNYTVSIYDASRQTKTSEPSVERPREIATNEVSDLAYVTDYNGYLQVLNLSTSKLVKSVAVQVSADGVAYAPGASTIYVAYYYDTNVTAVSALNYSTLKTVQVGGCPAKPAYDSRNRTLFVSNTCGSTLTVLNTTSNAITERLTLPSPPATVAYDGVRDVLWVGENSGNVSAYNASTYSRISTLRAPGGVRMLALDPQAGFVYAIGANSTGTPCVTVVDEGRLSVVDQANLSLYSNPYDIAVDRATHAAWVPDFSYGRVWVLSPLTWRVTFQETGLAGGTVWSVGVDGVNRSSSAPQISFSLLNGSYAFAIPRVAGYRSMSTGTVTVGGADQTVNVTFAPVTYSVSCSESGLPAGTAWGMTLGGQHRSSVTSAVVFAEPNGTWSYSIDPIPGYSTTWSGSVTVVGASASVRVAFTAVTFSVRFVEMGLPAGASWSVTVGAASATSSSATIALDLPNGSMTYVLGGVPGWSTANYTGTLTVNGSPVTLTVAWRLATFPVTFVQTGLPGGTRWWVNISGVPSAASVSANLSLDVPNGTYSYTVATSNKEYDSGGGAFTVNGQSFSGTVTFLPVIYTVQFDESGLPVGTVWSVLFHSVNESGSGGLNFSGIPNGSYAYSIAPVSGFDATPSSGYLRIHGAPSPVMIAFSAAGPPGGPGSTTPSLFGLSPTSTYGLIGALVAVGTVVAAVFALRRGRGGGSDEADGEEPPIDP